MAIEAQHLRVQNKVGKAITELFALPIHELVIDENK